MEILRQYAGHHIPRQKPLRYKRLRELWWHMYVATMPIHHWNISSRAADLLTHLRRTQWATLQNVERLQQCRLRQLLTHAWANVPYYRRIMDELGISPYGAFNINTVLRRLPLLEKDAVRNAADNGLLSTHERDARRIAITTSGSTGEPMRFFVDAFQLEMRWATTWRNFEWAGYRFGDRHVRLWHQTIGMSPLQIVREWLQSALCRRTFVPIFKLGDKTIDKFVSRIERSYPVLIDGYAEALSLLASYMRSRELAGNGAMVHRPRGIISSAQMLPDHSRRLIEGVFGCQVFDKYGAREFSGIAHECECRRMHVNAESYIVEILYNGRPARTGEVGEVVITDLNNRVMPFIRYRIGDLATAVLQEPCECGRGLPTIGAVEGRIQAIIVGTNGRYLSGTFFAHLLKDYVGMIRQFQVVQHQHGQLAVKVVRADGLTQAVLNGLNKVLHDNLGKDMVITYELVDEIPLGRTGKHCHSISHLKVDFNEGRIYQGR